MKRISWILMFAFLFLTHILIGQDAIPIGSWRTHLPFNKIVSVTHSGSHAYFAAEQMIVEVSKNDGSVRRLDRVNGLSDVEIKLIKYHIELGALIIVYENSNVDIIKDDVITNIADINRFLLINDKAINDIYLDGNFAYLSAEFGVVVLDLERLEIKATYLTDNIPVNACSVLNDTIFMGTEDGIYQGNPDQNLLDFSKWFKHDATQGLMDAPYFTNVMAVYNDKVYADINDTLMFYQNGQWSHQRRIIPNDTIPYFHMETQYFKSLEVSFDGNILLMTTRSNIHTMRLNDVVFTFYNPELGDPREVVYDGFTFWFGDYFTGAYAIQNFQFSKIDINAPYSSLSFDLEVSNDNLFVASGGVTDRWGFKFNRQGVFEFIDNEWSFRNFLVDTTLNAVTDYLSVAIRPSDGKMFAGSFSRGLIEFGEEGSIIYDDQNSTLQSPALDQSSVRVAGITFDNDENLWVCNFEAQQPISVFKKDGTWQSFSIPSQYAQLTDVIIDRNGYKWFASASESGVLVYNDNGTIDNPADDQYRVLNTSNSELPNNEVFSLVEDVDGDIWIGTAEGTVVFECSGQVFTDGCPGRLVIVEEDDFGAHLLATENIRTIAVDGADRKWFGTDNGIFVQAEDGESTELRFTTDNSPLLSNKIIDITINPNDGEVFIATENGIISYRGQATEGGTFHDEEIVAFPNPVRPDYDGPIAIRGLVEDATVKITNVSGTLVYEAQSQGGQLLWDGRDYSGNKAASGVYLVFSARKDGLENLVTKFVIVN